MRRYHEFHGRRDPAGLSAEHVTAFLNALATRRHVAASTQNQALAALLFLYRTFLASSSPGSTTSSTPRRPHAFRSCTRDEVRAVLARMDGEPRLMATLLYGCGLRLLECCRLRVKDVDFGRNQITIRRGKGDKDRATMLPVSIKSELAVHLERVRTQHERDLANGAGWVELPVLSRPALDVDARGGEDPGFGDNTLLGRLEMIGDRLVLEVNSAGRLARARQWLEGLPGVSFERATARDVLSESRPVDDKLPARPVKVEPEMLRAIEQMHRDLLRGWVDQPIPALGGLSPRQACKTPEGRRRVERLVRTMPAATYPGGTLPPLRDELLRELGLKR